MEYVVLGLLNLGASTIYELNKAFKQGISLFYSASYGSLQATLKKLMEANYIEMTMSVENGRQKKHYHITEEGREHFLKWMIEEIAPGNKLEVTVLSKLFFLGLIESGEEREALIGKMIDAIDVACVELKQADEELQTLPKAVLESPVFHFQYRTLLYGRNAHSKALTWFRELLDEEKNRNKVD